MLQPTPGYLLFSCLRGLLGLEPLHVLTERMRPGDWDQLLAEACLHDMTSVLHCLAREQAAGFPGPFRRELERRYARVGAENAGKLEKLDGLLWELLGENVPVLLLKGAVLAPEVYRDWAVRPMTDFDLLVRDEDLGRAEAALLRLRYAPAERYRDTLVSVDDDHYHLVPYVENEARTMVELHWNLAPFTLVRLDVEPLWQRAQRVGIGRLEVLTLSPTDLLLHLCLHIAVLHRFSVKLRDLYDVDQAVRKYEGELDWGLLTDLATDLHLEKGVRDVLLVVRHAFETPVAEEALTGLGAETNDLGAVDVLQDFILRAPFADVYRILRLRRELARSRFRAVGARIAGLWADVRDRLPFFWPGRRLAGGAAPTAAGAPRARGAAATPP